MSVRVVEAGLLTTVQDRGRFGYAALGVGRAGAMDAVCARLANALVDNAADAALIEICMRGPRLVFEEPQVIAITGAAFDARIDGKPMPTWQTLHVAAGSTLVCGHARHGAFAYLAIAGGIAAAPVIGSASTDLNAKIGSFGSRAICRGDQLETNATRLVIERSPTWSLDPRPWFDNDADAPVHAMRGSHFDALDDDSRADFFDATFRVGAQSNRVGYRLEGVGLRLAAPLELVSEAVTAGTVQLPPAGVPIALLAEHPTVGGYPRIAQIAAIDASRLAQRRLGADVRFCEIAPDDAQSRYLQRERELARLIDQIRQRLAE